MATFSFNTTGSITYLPSNLSASQAVTWSITESNPGTSYFTLETFPNSDGQYSSSSPKNTSGSFTYNSGITNVVYDDYKMSAVVKQGGGELYFVPAVPITGSDLRVRGVGGRPSYDALLDRWPNAAAAYSLRRLNSYYDGPAVRVRRSSDDTETDINFIGTSLDTTTLENFTKEEVLKYQSNFGVNTTGVYGDQASILANQDNISDGTVSKDDCLKVTVNTAVNETHQLVIGGGKQIGFNYRVSFEYYIPEINAEVNAIFAALYSGSYFLTTVGSWETFEAEFPSNNINIMNNNVLHLNFQSNQ
jgi:hypothetical protein